MADDLERRERLRLASLIGEPAGATRRLAPPHLSNRSTAQI